MTYVGEGVNKAGVNARVHTIIFSSNKYPCAYPGEDEKGMMKAPIRMVPSSSSYTLDDGSRLNYGNPFTIEYNVKVWFIGTLDPESIQWLWKDYNAIAVIYDQAQGGGSSTGYDSRGSYTSGLYPEPSTSTDNSLPYGERSYTTSSYPEASTS